MGLLLVCIVGILCVCVNVGINVYTLTTHVNVIMGGRLDEHLVFWQPTLSIILYVNCTVDDCAYCLLFEIEIKYDGDDDDDS